jgi:hypothetical protein
MRAPAPRGRRGQCGLFGKFFAITPTPVNAAITGGVAFTVDQVDDLAVDVAVRLSVVERESFDYTIGCTRVICNPAGYSCEANPEFNWDLVS